MSLETEGFKFSCPFCTQRIRAFPEHVGGVVSCPGCGEELSVPNPDTGFHHVDHTKEGMWGFSAEEWQLIQGEDYEAVERIIAYPRQLWWECGAAAELMAARIVSLTDATAHFREVYYHEGNAQEHVAFIYRAQEQVREFCDILNFSYYLLTTQLQEAVVGHSLVPVVRVVDRISREMNRARDFHESVHQYSLPQESPCPAIHQILATWAPHFNAVLQTIIEQLRERAEYLRDIEMHLRLHVSLIPPNLTQLFLLLNEMTARYSQPQQ